MKIRWLIEKNVFPENEKLITDALKVLKKHYNKEEVFDYKFVNYNDFNIIKDNSDIDILLYYGSINQTLRLLKKSSKSFVNVLQSGLMYPIAWFNNHNLSYHIYSSYWNKYILNKELCYLTFKELKRQKENLYHFGYPIFIRPDNNVKTFTGELVAYDKFDSWYQNIQEKYNPEPEMFVLVAKNQNILNEWRFIVVNKEVITGSLYQKAGLYESNPIIDPKALELAKIIASEEWQPDEAYVLDICQTKDGYSLLEIGSVNTASWYDCNYKDAMMSLTNLAINNHNDFFDLF